MLTNIQARQFYRKSIFVTPALAVYLMDLDEIRYPKQMDLSSFVVNLIVRHNTTEGSRLTMPPAYTKVQFFC